MKKSLAILSLPLASVMIFGLSGCNDEKEATDQPTTVLPLPPAPSDPPRTDMPLPNPSDDVVIQPASPAPVAPETIPPVVQQPAPSAPQTVVDPVPPVAAPVAPPEVSYPNCAAAKDAGAAPIQRGEPGYSSKLDRDGDGVACDK